MAKNDEFDSLLRDERITDDEWWALSYVLENYHENKIKRIEFMNEEFRHCFGHTFANFFRNKYEPDYKTPILKETFETFGIGFDSRKSIFELEEIFFNVVTNGFDLKSTCDKNNLYFNKTFLYKLIEIGKDSYGIGKRIKNLSLKDGAVAIAGGLPLAFVNKTFFDTNWKKVIPTILIISLIRKRLKIADEFKEI